MNAVLLYCIAGNFRQRKISSKATVRQFIRNIYFRQVPVFARLLFDRSVVALLLTVYLPIHESISYSKRVVSIEKISPDFNLVKNCFDESDKIKFLTKISCYTVFSALSLSSLF